MLQWHRKQTEKWQKKFNVDAYGLGPDCLSKRSYYGFTDYVVLYLIPLTQ